MRIFSALLAISFLSACATAPAPPPDAPPQPTATNSAAPPPGDAPPASTCAGPIQAPPPGLEALDEPAPSFAIGAPGKGSLCEGKVFSVKVPVTVYRVFTADFQTAKKAGPTGAYWTLEMPSGSKDNYRTNYEICAEWNDLDMLNTCKVNVGAKVVIGPGQSADCDSGTKYPPSASNQVLIVKEQDGKVPVSDCKSAPMGWAP